MAWRKDQVLEERSASQISTTYVIRIGCAGETHPHSRRGRRRYGLSVPFFLPGRLAGFSWMRSRKPPRMPVARPTLDSPNLSRRRSAAAMRVFPALLAVAFQQVDLIGLRCELGGLHSEKANRGTPFPILAEQSADLLEDFCVELGRCWERMGAGQGREVFVAKFELNRARVELGFAQTAGRPFRKGASAWIRAG